VWGEYEYRIEYYAWSVQFESAGEFIVYKREMMLVNATHRILTVDDKERQAYEKDEFDGMRYKCLGLEDPKISHEHTNANGQEDLDTFVQNRKVFPWIIDRYHDAIVLIRN
jgi:hypothetical protein